LLVDRIEIYSPDNGSMKLYDVSRDLSVDWDQDGALAELEGKRFDELQPRGGDEHRFPGDRQSVEPNSTGGSNVRCIASSNTCWVSKGERREL